MIPYLIIEPLPFRNSQQRALQSLSTDPIAWARDIVVHTSCAPLKLHYAYSACLVPAATAASFMPTCADHLKDEQPTWRQRATGKRRLGQRFFWYPRKTRNLKLLSCTNSFCIHIYIYIYMHMYT